MQVPPPLMMQPLGVPSASTGCSTSYNRVHAQAPLAARLPRSTRSHRQVHEQAHDCMIAAPWSLGRCAACSVIGVGQD